MDTVSTVSNPSRDSNNNNNIHHDDDDDDVDDKMSIDSSTETLNSGFEPTKRRRLDCRGVELPAAWNGAKETKVTFYVVHPEDGCLWI